MRSFRIEGIVIKRRNVGEADRMLTVFSKRLGKITVKAVGVRRISSRRSPHLELLNHSLLTLYKGPGIPIVTEAQTIEDFSDIKEDLTKVGFAYHLCELIDGLCAENQEHYSVFELLCQTLKRLENSSFWQARNERVQNLSSVEDSGVVLQSRTPQNDVRKVLSNIVHDFEIALLSQLGFYRSSTVSPVFNTALFIEQILEKKLKSLQILPRLV